MEEDRASWPALPYAKWQDTCTTQHLWTQIVGKIRLAQAPWLYHFWHATPVASARRRFLIVSGSSRSTSILSTTYC